MEGFSFRLETEILGNQSQNDKFIPQDFFFYKFWLFQVFKPIPPNFERREIIPYHTHQVNCSHFFIIFFPTLAGSIDPSLFKFIFQMT